MLISSNLPYPIEILERTLTIAPSILWPRTVSLKNQCIGLIVISANNSPIRIPLVVEKVSSLLNPVITLTEAELFIIQKLISPKFTILGV